METRWGDDTEQADRLSWRSSSSRVRYSVGMAPQSRLTITAGGTGFAETSNIGPQTGLRNVPRCASWFVQRDPKREICSSSQARFRLETFSMRALPVVPDASLH